MSEAKHTPGPWSLCNDGKCSCLTVSCGDHPIATVTSGEWGDEWPSLRFAEGGEGSVTPSKVEAYMEKIVYGAVDKDVAVANARLIAAAPELLEALNAALGYLTNAAIDLETGVSKKIALSTINYGLDVIRAAIAKATGAS